MIVTKTSTIDRYKALRNILGKEYVRGTVESPFDFIRMASKGINAHIIVNFRNHFKISREDAAEMLNVSEPTVYRWVRENKKLNRNYSIQLFELTDLFLTGTDVFQSQENFFKWLELPNTAFGNLQPKELLEISGGVSKVKDLLGRIEYGVFS